MIKMKSTNKTPSFVSNADSSEFKNNGRDFLAKQMDFLSSFKPIYYFSRLLGLMPFKIVCNLNGEFRVPRVGKLDGIWFIAAICVYLSLTFFVCQHIDLNMNLSRSENVLVHGNHLRIASNLICDAIAICMDMWNRFKLVNLFKKVLVFDKKVSLVTLD